MNDDDGIVTDDVVDELSDSKQNIFIFLYNSATSYFETYGWFILIGFVICYFLYNYIRQRFPNLLSGESFSRTHVDEDEALKRMQSIEAARLRQQAAFEAAKLKYLEEKKKLNSKKKEEREAREKAEEWERHQQGLGYKSKIKKPTEDKDDELAKLGLSSSSSIPKKPKKPLRDSDYNPLTGTSSSSSANVCYRPSKRGGASQGG